MLTLSSGCVHAPTSGEPFERGLASFYGAELAGSVTASGVKFDPTQLVAAHRTLPFRTCVAVRAVNDGRTVEVTVIDRGPHVAGRVIDLSRAAAEQLGMIAQGVIEVELSRCAAASLNGQIR